MKEAKLDRPTCLHLRQLLTNILFEIRNLERVNDLLGDGCPEITEVNRLNILIQRNEIQVALQLLNLEMKTDADPQ